MRTLRVGSVSCVRFETDNAETLLVRADEWALLGPYLVDGTFDPTITSPAAKVVLDPSKVFDGSTAEVTDDALYARVLAVLTNLFPVGFPTSTL